MKRAFTVAETLIVMTIVSIIVLILVSNSNLIFNKRQHYKELALKTLEEFDVATRQVIDNYSPDNTMAHLLKHDERVLIDRSINYDSSFALKNLYMQFLTSKRNGSNSGPSLVLKNNVLILFHYNALNNVSVFLPSSNKQINCNAPYGFIIVDANGLKDPNILGVDKFVIPFGLHGLEYFPVEIK